MIFSLIFLREGGWLSVKRQIRYVEKRKDGDFLRFCGDKCRLLLLIASWLGSWESRLRIAIACVTQRNGRRSI